MCRKNDWKIWVEERSILDKFEYKIKADEMKELIAQKEYEQAAEIADSIDWRRVKKIKQIKLKKKLLVNVLINF